jgi:PAS domain S-box-containing protein
VNSRGEYQFVNQSACQLTGFSEGELLQMNLGQLAAPSNFENSLNSFRILQETGRVKQEIVLRKKEGVDINMMLEATKIDDENYIGFCSDLSEIKKSQKELQKINANLRIFNDVLAHDLKEPARTIRQLMELLLRKYAPELDHGMQELIQMAKEVADKNEQMIAGMYQFLVLGNKNIVKSKISMGEIIEHALKLIGTLFKESGATITTGQMPMVEGEMSLLVQLLQNLLQNSIKFAQKNIKPILEFSVESVGNKMIFALKDNGRGIEKNNLPKVFGLFYRIHEENNTEGLGLGLSLCKRIVELHGGEIWVESQVNQGTTLYFSLPKVDILKKNQ